MAALETLLSEGKLKDARSQAERTLLHRPDDLPALLALAKIHLFEGNLPSAEMFLGQAERHGQTAQTELLRANLYAQKGEYEQARPLYQHLASLAEPPAEAFFGLGLLAKQDGDREAALRHLERAIELSPRQGVFHFHLAEVLAQLDRDPPRVLDHLAQAISLNPFFVPSYLLLSRIYAVNGRVAQAKKVLEEGLRVLPGNVPLTSALTNVDMLEGDVGGAFASAAALAARFPDDPKAVSNLALLLLAQHRYDEAMQLCQQMSRKHRSDAALKSIEATVYEARKPPAIAEAVKAYEEAMSLDLGDWRAANNLGQLLLRRKDGDPAKNVSRAITVLEEASRRKPDQLEPKLNLALAYVRANQRQKSAKLAEEILQAGLPPEHPIRDQAQRLVAALRR